MGIVSANKDHPERKPMRLPHYDYRKAGAYFITINSYQRELLFGEVVDGVMQLNEFGGVVQEAWEATPKIRAYVELDEYVVMPNHFHGILFIHEHAGNVAGNQASVRATRRSPLPRGKRPQGPPSDSIGAVIAGFKSSATKRINLLRKLPGHPVWQRSFYDNVIRSEKRLMAVREYIRANPSNWAEDEYHPDMNK